jgi:hypothetical protein
LRFRVVEEGGCGRWSVLSLGIGDSRLAISKLDCEVG